MTQFLIGVVLLVITFFVWVKVFPSKKYMSDIYQEMYRRQDKQTKMITDMRNVFFSRTRKSKKGVK